MTSQGRGVISELAWTIALASFVMTTVAARAASTPDIDADRDNEVSVRLRPLKNEVSVSGSDLIVSAAKGASIALASGFQKFTLRLSSKKPLSWRMVSLSGREFAQVLREPLNISGRNLRIDLRPAPDRIRIVSSAAGASSLVGLFALEDYLEGVVASEVPRAWPLEALKAQAVAARTFAVSKIRERSANTAKMWMLEADVTDQVFDLHRRSMAASRAVRETAGEVLVNARGGIGHAFYHSDCGGKTEEASRVWGGEGAATGTTVDAGCGLSSRSQWRYVTDTHELAAQLKAKRFVGANFLLNELRVLTRTPSGRADRIELKPVTGAALSLTGDRLRSIIGYSSLKSTAFAVSQRDGRIEFNGRGFGHGAGMCQWGAREMASAGRSYGEILKHYYPLLRIEAAPGRWSQLVSF